MNCPVCRKEFSGGFCPRCQFPEIHIVGDLETGLKRMKPEIDAYRSDFYKRVSLKLVIHHWHDVDGVVCPEREEAICFGTADTLGGAHWLEGSFARIPDVPELKLQVQVCVDDEVRELQVAVPNLQQASLQQVGVELAPDDTFRILLRNESESTASAPTALFD